MIEQGTSRYKHYI